MVDMLSISKSGRVQEVYKSWEKGEIPESRLTSLFSDLNEQRWVDLDTCLMKRQWFLPATIVA